MYARIEKAGEKQATNLAGLVMPQGCDLPPCVAVRRQARQSLGRFDMRCRHGLKRPLAPIAKEPVQRREGRLEPQNKIPRGAPIVLPHAADGGVPASAGFHITGGPFERRLGTVEAVAKVGGPERSKLERAGGAAHVFRFQAEPSQWMFEECHHCRKQKTAADRLVE